MSTNEPLNDSPDSDWFEQISKPDRSLEARPRIRFAERPVDERKEIIKRLWKDGRKALKPVPEVLSDEMIDQLAVEIESISQLIKRFVYILNY